jgi:hypothetical protein
MKKRIAFALALLPLWVLAQPDTRALIDAQHQAMKPLAMMDGVWRGPAFIYQRGGTKLELTQTERIGPFLGGSVKVIEGRGYGPDGAVHFNALGVISFSPQTGKYSIHSHAQGLSGNFALDVRPDGYAWSHPAGPNARIHFTATIKDGTLVEVGEYVADGAPRVKTFEMHLKRIGDTDWPAAGAVPMR